MIKYIKSSDEFTDDITLYTVTITDGERSVDFDYSSVDNNIETLAITIEDYLYHINF